MQILLCGFNFNRYVLNTVEKGQLVWLLLTFYHIAITQPVIKHIEYILFTLVLKVKLYIYWQVSVLRVYMRGRLKYWKTVNVQDQMRSRKS